MNNRNQHRALNNEQIQNIIEQMAEDFRKYPRESAEYLIDYYLTGDTEGMFKLVSDWIEGAEDEVIKILNTDSIEDSFNDYNYIPSYDL
jgi:hypothetical protein